MAEITERSNADPLAFKILQAVRAELSLTTPWRYLGKPVLVRFPLADTSVEILHLLGEVPDGFMVLDTDARIKRTPGTQYGKTTAFLQANMANATATLAFGVLRERETNVNPT